MRSKIVRLSTILGLEVMRYRRSRNHHVKGDISTGPCFCTKSERHGDMDEVELQFHLIHVTITF